MKLVRASDLEKDKYYMIYENGGYYKVMMICYITGDLVDTWADDDDSSKFRWLIDGNSYSDYQCIADYDETTDSSGIISREFKGVDLTITDPDDYSDGFRLKDNETALIYELTDEEAHLQLINRV